MADLEYTVTNQGISTSKTSRLVSGTIGVYTVKFTFNNVWDGLEKWATFDPIPGTPYKQPLDANGECTIPGEVMGGVYLRIGVFGLAEGQAYPTIWASKLPLEEGCFVNVPPSDWPEPSPLLEDVVKVSEQTFTDAQKTQARTNIGAAGSAEMTTALAGKVDKPEDATPGNVAVIGSNGNVADGGKALDDLALDSDLTALANRVTAIEDEEGLHKYGVSGIGQKANALTRLWDAIGMTAQVGTDGDNSSVVNDFDHALPWMRKKCVGYWEKIDGRAVFHVMAYLGDDNYAEDGTIGDYVAVECPRCYYTFENGVLGISSHHYDGWRPFDIFCRDHNPEDTMEHFYAPAYSLAVKDGKAVSLPGYDNEQGGYATLLNTSRTYANDDVKALGMIMPMAFNFYEWALYTVEFATQNVQAIMAGCSGLRHNAADRVTFVDSTHAITADYQAARVAGERIAITPDTVDINAVAYKATHEITAIIRCDANGNADASGTHQLLTLEDLGRNYWTYDTTTAYRLAARAYETGACNGVSTPSGSPVSNSDSYHPMKYRHRENAFGNQFQTTVDFFSKRVGSGDSDYYLEWYYLPEPKDYVPSASDEPKVATLASAPFVKIDLETSHANYVSGYIKSKTFSATYRDVWIPYETTGASATTYVCDYANLVNSYTVRSFRLGGDWTTGAYVGFSYMSASYYPSLANASYGAALFFYQ